FCRAMPHAKFVPQPHFDSLRRPRISRRLTQRLQRDPRLLPGFLQRRAVRASGSMLRGAMPQRRVELVCSEAAALEAHCFKFFALHNSLPFLLYVAALTRRGGSLKISSLAINRARP